MKKAVGVRELRAKVSPILRRVREKGETVDVTYRGEVIARIVPVVPPAKATQALRSIWADIDQLAEEIGRQWKPKGESAAEAVSEGRRG